MGEYLQQPAITDFTNVELPSPQEYRLKNGIILKVINSGDQEVNRLDLIFNGGVYDQEYPMVSSAMPLMLRHGGGDYTSQELAEKLDFYGAWIQGRGYDHHTSLTIYSINRWFKEILDIAEVLIKSPLFPEHEFEVIKTQFEGNLMQSKEQVKYLASREFNRLFFGESHPLGRIVDVEDAKAMNTQMLTDFHSSFYKPQNCTIILSGIVSDDMIKQLDEAFGGNWGDIDHKEEQELYHIEQSTQQFSIVDKPDAIQAAVIIGLKAIPRFHPDYIPLRILITAFGGYFGSRLMSNIREDKGYTYGISAGLIGRTDISYIQIVSECATEYTYLLIDEVKAEMDKLIVEALDEEELSRVKSYMLSDLVKTGDTPFSIADYAITSISCDIPDDYFSRQVAIINTITAQELLEIAKKYLDTQKLFISIAGDRNKL